jgi:hypothetical protein
MIYLSEIKVSQFDREFSFHNVATALKGSLGLGKRKNFLEVILASKGKSAECSMSMAFPMMCTEKIQGFSSPFFVVIFARVYVWQ